MSLSPRRILLSTAAIVGAVTLASWAASGPGSPTSPPGDGTRAGVETARAATVLDDGTGPELCLGAILESYPPQCSGPAMTGWDWADWEGQHDEASGVRWGLFWVAGHYDPRDDTFEVAEAELAAARTWPVYEDPADFTASCPAPTGGWKVVDPARTTQESLDRTLAFAATMDGYAGAWIDQSVNPAAAGPPESGDDDDMIAYELSMNDPTLLILNVRTTGDLGGAESALREHWGGMLCVSAAERTEEELLRIQEELNGISSRQLSSWPDITTGIVRADVAFDDGSLQDSLDDHYGEGVVKVTSALIPWP